MKLEGKRVLVTGGSRGIGYAIAGRMLQEGAQVVITGRHRSALEAAADSLGAGARFLAWDSADVSAIPEKLDAVEAMLGGLDVLINNAGVLTAQDWDGMMAVTPESWDATMNVNLRGVFFLCQGAARRWIEGKQGGRIVNVCSNNAFRALDTAYAASKWAIRGLTMGMAKRLAPHGIFVNAVAPGPTSTSMMACADGETHAFAGAPLGRFSYPEEIAGVCAFLASEEAGSMVGQVLVADGGETLL